MTVVFHSALIELSASIPGARHPPVDAGVGDRLKEFGALTLPVMLQPAWKVVEGPHEPEIMPGVPERLLKMNQVQGHQITERIDTMTK